MGLFLIFFFNFTNGTKSRKASHLIDTLLIAIHNLLHAIISNYELCHLPLNRLLLQ